MSYTPTPREWIEIGAEAIRSVGQQVTWDENTECDIGDSVDHDHWACNPHLFWPGRHQVAAEIIRALREAGLMKDISEAPEQHIVTFWGTQWGLQHPLACRPNLLDCEVHQAFLTHQHELTFPPAEVETRAVVTLDNNVLNLEFS